MIPEKLENHIFQYLDEIFVDDLKWVGTILKRDKKLLCGDEILLFINTDSDFIKIEQKHLNRMTSWFGTRDFNQYRGVFVRWLLKKFKVPSIHELKLDAINKTMSNKFG